MLIRPLIEPLRLPLQLRGRQALEAPAGLNAREQLELACRSVVGVLAAARPRFEIADEMLTALEAQPPTTRELLLRRIAEAWLEGQKEDHAMPQCSGCSSAVDFEWEGENPGWDLCRKCLLELEQGNLSAEKVLWLRRTSLGGFYLLQHQFYDREGRRTTNPMPA